MDKFKVYRLREVDKKVVAAFEESSLSELDPGEVVVRVGYSCVNYKDALAATGAGKIIRRFPCVGGIDLAGTVTESQDPRFKKGDAVIGTSYDIGVAHDGGYGEYARLKADWLVPMPKGMSLFDAMALGTAGFTAGLAVVRMEHEGLKPGDGPVIVTGATDVMLRSGLDLAKIRPLDKATWAGAVDNLGGDVLAWLASTMKIGAPLASVGLAASTELKTTVAPFILRGVSLLGVDSVNCPMPRRRQVWERLAGDMRPKHLAAMTRTIPFDDLPKVFDDFLKARIRGRIVVDLAAG